MTERIRTTASRLSRGADPSARPFVHRLALIVVLAIAAIAAWRLSDVLLVGLGTALLALLLRGLAGAVARSTRIPEAWAVVPVMVGLLAALGAVGWLFGSQVALQFDVLAVDLPRSVSQVASGFAATTWGAWFLDYAQGMDVTGLTGQVAGRVATFFGSAFRAGAYMAVLVFAAVYLAAQPERYRQGLLRLIPPDRRDRLSDVLDLVGATLRRWLIGQSVTMAVVGTLTGVGLWALGVAAPLALGLIAGVFAFVPFVGPILASVPGILMAATQGPMPALYAAALYGAVHVVEGNLITPLVQAEVVKLPPVMTLFATLAFGVLLGPVGVLLAAPLTVILLVAVNALYLEDVLGEPRAWPPLHSGNRDD
ncbi:MAG TPA: AI-2E family transporter [Stellaceae bacterium]|nr:AI-2E family transporter [Stellaceae bacterium]